MDALSKAVKVAHGQSALARLIGNGCKQGHVWAWLNREGAEVPPDRCVAIEAATGVRCEELRPDIQWQRDDSGQVTGYVVPVPAQDRAA